METASNASSASGIIYRDYTDADDAQCKALEERSMQGSRNPRMEFAIKTLFRASFEHNVTFDAKAKQYGSFAVKVAEVESTKSIVGVCCAVLKKVWLHGDLHVVGYIFELRIDEAYQSKGIGKTLTQQIEEVCIARGATYLYLSVNDDNTKARNLYGKRGYNQCSVRKPVQFILMEKVVESTEVAVDMVSMEEGLRLTQESYGKTDMLLENIRPIFESPLYEGTLIARSGDSIAGLSLWNGSYFVGFRVTRFFLPVWCWRLRSVRAVFSISLLYLGWRWVSCMHYHFLEAWGHGGIYNSTLFSLKALMTLGVSVAVAKVWKVLSFVGRKITSPGTKLRGRAFGVFASGPKEDQERLLQAVLLRAQNIQLEKGYTFMLLNLDEKYEHRHSLSPAPFTTLFMLKYVGVGTGAKSTVFAPDNFFDPRDI